MGSLVPVVPAQGPARGPAQGSGRRPESWSDRNPSPSGRRSGDQDDVVAADAETVVGVVLAAGGGTRFRGPTHKLLAPFGHSTVIGTVLDAVMASVVDRVVVVTGAIRLPDAILDRPGIVVVHNPDWAEGQSTSVRAGVEAAAALGADAVVIGLGDQPLVPTAAWNAVASGRTPIVVATYDGARGNPVRLDRSVWPDLPTSGDHGARHLIGQRPELVSEVACPGSSADIDTREDLDRWT